MQYTSSITWKRGETPFDYESFDRDHLVTFPGGVSFKASSAPEFKGNPAAPNPEQILAASLASCHMLTFLAVASKSRLTVNSYEDHAVATLAPNAQGQMAVTRIELSPRVVFQEALPEDKIRSLHEKAHRNCFIAHSLSCEISIQPKPAG